MAGEFQGWIPPDQRSADVQASFELLQAKQGVFSSVGAPIADTGKGKVVLLHKVLEQLIGSFPIHLQTIGDCVSHGWALGIDVLKAVEIVLRNEPEEFVANTATEWIYGTSRVIQGRGQLGNQDGSLGSWAAASVKDNGTLSRQKYGDIDLREYSGQRAKSWGYRGLPKELESIADETPVKTTALVTSYEEARDAIANGYPVPVCSMRGFEMRRDSQGFARPKGQWAHCMLFMSVDDESSRPGLLCMNSWGADWISGPKRHGQPEGSFWVDADVADKMLKGRDSYAISGFEGYPSRTLDPTLF